MSTQQSTSLETLTLDHPSLGNITGRLVDKKHFDGTPVKAPVAHFRSIPYATFPGRFKQSTVLDSLPESFDERPKGVFTEYGYACPQVPQPRETCGGVLLTEGERRYDENTCLNLTISAPVSKLRQEGGADKGKLLPVMVYVHGGGFVEGTGHVSTQHETLKMADLASTENMDVILVNIGYRLNWHGFLACQDLIDEAEEEAEEEAKAGKQRQPLFNYGLHDQRNAFLWIKRHIAGFGGDPNRIAAFGESAGACSLSYHMLADVPVFNRVILQSGSSAILGEWTLDQHNALYQGLLKFLGIEATTSAERLKALRAVPTSRLVDSIRELGVGAIRPYTGKETSFFTVPPVYKNQMQIMANCPWLGDIMVGDTHFEGYMFNAPLKDISHSKLVKAFEEVFGPESAKRVLDLYDIPVDGEIQQNRLWQQSMELVGDIIFGEPMSRLANALVDSKTVSRKVWRYQFLLQNHFPGSAFSYVTGHHFLDLYYQFMTLTNRYPRWRDRFLERQSIEMARIWIRFGNGLPPWENGEYSKEQGHIAICDELRGWQVRTRKEDEEISKDDPWGPRRYQHWETLEQAFEDLGEEGADIQQGKVNAARLQLIDFKRLQLDEVAVGGPIRF